MLRSQMTFKHLRPLHVFIFEKKFEELLNTLSITVYVIFDENVNEIEFILSTFLLQCYSKLFHTLQFFFIEIEKGLR